MPAVIVESKEPLRVSVSNVNPIASGVVHAMTRPEAFVIIFSCWLSIWRRLALADGSQIVGGEEVTLQAGAPLSSVSQRISFLPAPIEVMSKR